MRKFAFVILMILIASDALAQWTSENSVGRFANCIWYMGNDGYYHKKTDVSIPVVDNVVEIYGYNKSTQNLYLLTENATVIVTLNKEEAKEYKKRKDIKQVDGSQVYSWFELNNKLLEAKFKQMNADYVQHKKDSIAQEKAAQEIARIDNYRATHRWQWVPTPTTLYCKDCGDHFKEDSLFCVAIKNDSIYYFHEKNCGLGVNAVLAHYSHIPSRLASNDSFKMHCEVFKDSLFVDFDPRLGMALYNESEYSKALSQIKEFAPYGYFDSWNWGAQYGNITFDFRYTNTNKKTIKYIEVFFTVKNDVGDVRKTGSFKGTGPVDEFMSASWDWDHSSYYVAGDATHMDLTKAIITYMDGTQKVLSKNMLVFE